LCCGFILAAALLYSLIDFYITQLVMDNKKEENMRRIQFKSILSTILICSFIGAAVTGLMMYFGHSGGGYGVARHGVEYVISGYNVKQIHFVFSIIMICGVVIHFILNAGIYKNEVCCLMKKQTKKPL